MSCAALTDNSFFISPYVYILHGLQSFLLFGLTIINILTILHAVLQFYINNILSNYKLAKTEKGAEAVEKQIQSINFL